MGKEGVVENGEGERMNHILGRRLRKGKLDRRDDVSFDF